MLQKELMGKNLLARLEKGDVHEDLPPYRDPRNAVFVGSNGGQAAFLKPEPLALVAVGLSDIFPQLLKVTTASKDTFLFLMKSKIRQIS